ncbi:hypothetical protein B0T13DRAFT_473990 [Neurospora crassa]|nr:hypothetical protein B0T13DRAFT_473990 [Neurospora crassa]
MSVGPAGSRQASWLTIMLGCSVAGHAEHLCAPLPNGLASRVKRRASVAQSFQDWSRDSRGVVSTSSEWASVEASVHALSRWRSWCEA